MDPMLQVSARHEPDEYPHAEARSQIPEDQHDKEPHRQTGINKDEVSGDAELGRLVRCSIQDHARLRRQSITSRDEPVENVRNPNPEEGRDRESPA